MWLIYIFFSREREDRKAIKKEDFILDKLKDQTICRLPGSVNGQQFIVQNCDVNNRNSHIGKLSFFLIEL